MLTISARVDYGVQLLRQFARKQHTKPVPLQKVADELGLPYRYLAQIVRPLCRAGMLESTEGANGGYRLAKKPGAISLRAVIAVLEPERRIIRCLQTDHPTCPYRRRCGAHVWWRALDERITRELDATTLAHLV